MAHMGQTRTHRTGRRKMTASFPHLFQPLRIRGATLKNRIMSTGHDTTIPTDGTVNDRLVAYQAARAAGGAGLIVIQVAGVHESARYTNHILMANDDGCIEGYARLADACHAHDCTIFGQIFHPGREICERQEGLLTVAYAPSAVPSERFHVIPRALDAGMIRDIIDGFVAAAIRLQRAGLDGVEFVASHGYLPAQFFNPRVNLRDDEYGGSEENRLRFAREILAAIRAATGDDFVVGMRISDSERDDEGLTSDEVRAICRELEPLLDYVNVTTGTSASAGAAVHIVAPMSWMSGYVAPAASRIRAELSIPVFVTGRINQPQEADAIIASGAADVCGMTRALICDPRMPEKAQSGHSGDIRACIACNQACIGHFQLGVPISCIQHPETGREEIYGNLAPVETPRRVFVAGGGPAGMKAAVTAAKRGHDVTLFEAAGQLGGQARLAQELPRRAEFGGIITNLAREIELGGVKVVLNTPVTGEMLAAERPDALVIATGAIPFRPPYEEAGDMQVADAWQILKREINPGRRVVVVDWRGDWIGPGIAEALAARGHDVRLATTVHHAAAQLPPYVRDDLLGVLARQEIGVMPLVRLFGHDDSTVFLQHVVTNEPVMVNDVDTLVLATGHASVTGLESAARGIVPDIRVIGDSLAPRTAEEAVYDGLRVGAAI
ncbi:oxidoreductase, FMN-binding protein [Komagataeibacter xylinus E25]|nr:oxidoreductase, FMN-binding protein [Komagataeibacter xylinus E25]